MRHALQPAADDVVLPAAAAVVSVCTAVSRYELLNTGTGKIEIKHLTSEEAKNESANHFKVRGVEGLGFRFALWVLGLVAG